MISWFLRSPKRLGAKVRARCSKSPPKSETESAAPLTKAAAVSTNDGAGAGDRNEDGTKPEGLGAPCSCAPDLNEDGTKPEGVASLPETEPDASRLSSGATLI